MNNFEIYKTLLDNFLQKTPNAENLNGEKTPTFDEKPNQNILNLLLDNTQNGKLNLQQIINILSKTFTNANNQTPPKSDENLNSPTKTDTANTSTTNKTDANIKNDKSARIVMPNINPLINALKQHDDFVNRINNPVKKR